LLFWIFCPWLEVSFEKDDGGDGPRLSTGKVGRKEKEYVIWGWEMGDGELVLVEGLRLIM
jgi:hypothetical protein